MPDKIFVTVETEVNFGVVGLTIDFNASVWQGNFVQNFQVVKVT